MLKLDDISDGSFFGYVLKYRFLPVLLLSADRISKGYGMTMCGSTSQFIVLADHACVVLILVLISRSYLSWRALHTLGEAGAVGGVFSHRKHIQMVSNVVSSL